MSQPLHPIYSHLSIPVEHITDTHPLGGAPVLFSWGVTPEFQKILKTITHIPYMYIPPLVLCQIAYTSNEGTRMAQVNIFT